jgi:hypothetical protein
MARFKTEQRELSYRIYITDGLQVIGRLNRRFADSIAEDLKPDAEKRKKEPKETAEQIINRIKKGLAAISEGNEEGKEETE